MSFTLIVPPAIEPVTLAEMKLQCGLGPMEDADQLREQTVAEQMRAAISAARQDCENICRRAFVTQSWTLTRDRFPRWSDEYEAHHHQDFALPLPKFQSLTAFTYIDTAGNVQNNLASGAWGYQLVAGGDTQPVRLRPPVGRGWPWTQWQVADAVSITFRCGYGGPVTASMAATSAILSGPVWNQGDVGLAISVPGAGASGATLATSIASVDLNGQATLANAAATAVAGVTAYAGEVVPAAIVNAIKVDAKWFFEGCRGKQPEAVAMLLNPYTNSIS